LQAAIAAVHAEASSASRTDGHGLSDCTIFCCGGAVAGDRVEPRRGGGDARRTRAGLALIDAILASDDLDHYHRRTGACGPVRRLGRMAEARASYQRALVLARQEPERRFSSGG